MRARGKRPTGQPRLQTARAATALFARLLLQRYSERFAVPFRGMKTLAGGSILLTFEKSLWFTREADAPAGIDVQAAAGPPARP
jgi:hypothetical protein